MSDEISPHLDWPDNFGALEEEFSNYKNSKVVILPVPYEGTVFYKKGTKEGPRAIIEASKYMEVYDEELEKNTFTIGIHTLKELDVENKDVKEVIEDVKLEVGKILNDNKFPVVIGGEHSITIGCVKAFKEKFSDLTVLQLDAHADLRQSYEGNKFSHACVMARVIEVYPIVQVGIRSLSEEEALFIKNKNLKIFWARDIYNNNKWVDEVLSKLSGDVYITIDLDVFDIGIMPSSGSPEPGGLDWYTVANFLKKVGEEKNVVGFDVVELSPSKMNIAPDFLAAKLIYKLIGYFNLKHT
jgi:agmatinase